MHDDVCQVSFINEEKVARVKEKMSSSEALCRLAETFKVLGDPTRVHILHALSLDELCVCDIASLLGTSQSAVSHQLRLLRACRLVKFRKEGKMAYYCLDDDHVRQLLTQALGHVELG